MIFVCANCSRQSSSLHITFLFLSYTVYRSPLSDRHFAVDNERKEERAHNSRNDNIRENISPRDRATSKLQTKSTINHTEKNSRSASPDVHIRDERPATVGFVSTMVQQSTKGLEEQQSKQYDTDDGVLVRQQGQVCGEPDTHSRRSGETAVRENLEAGVYPDAHLWETYEGGADWEEGEEDDGS